MFGGYFSKIRLNLAALLFVTLLGSIFSCTAEAEEDQPKLTVTAYETEIEVFEDKSLQVEERMQIHFNVARHGPSFGLSWIYHDRPLIPSIAQGSGDYFFHFRDFLSGKDEYRFGNPFKEHPAGTDKEYTLKYRYQWPADEDPTEDEFYWNIINDQRPYRHESVKFKVTLPKPFKESQVDFTSGEWDDLDEGRVDWRVEGKSIVGKLRGPLEPNEAITLRIHLPEGYFSEARPLSFAEMDLRLYLVPWQLLPLLAVPLAFLIWWFLGRKRPIIIVETSYPPDQLNCAEAAWAYFGNSYYADFSNLILSWAQQGFLTIEELPDQSICLHRLADEPSPAAPYEQKLFKDMFARGNGDQVSVDQLGYSFYKDVNRAHQGMLDHLQATTPIYEPSNQQVPKWFNRLIWLAALPAVYYAVREAVFGNLLVMIFSLVVIALATLFFEPYYFLPRKAKRRSRKTTVANSGKPLGPAPPKGLVFFRVPMLMFLLIIGFAINAPTAILTWLVSLLVMRKLAVHCGKQTEYGRDVQGRVAGLREFILRADLDRIRELAQDNPNYFLEILPYAAALGAAEDWTKKFSKLKLPAPSWYRSAQLVDHPQDYNHIGAVLYRVIRNLNSKAAKEPQLVSSSSDYAGGSSSSSSSGSAGGGGGGSSMGDW